jgi:hypothetical protein
MAYGKLYLSHFPWPRTLALFTDTPALTSVLTISACPLAAAMKSGGSPSVYPTMGTTGRSERIGAHETTLTQHNILPNVIRCVQVHMHPEPVLFLQAPTTHQY